MKKYGFYPGCLMSTEQYSYELSLREMLPLLDIELVDLKGFSCCGEPMKSINKLMTLYLSARNLAVAEGEGLDLFVPCPRCHLSLSECKKVMAGNSEIRERINGLLSSEGLTYGNGCGIVHTLDLLYDHVEEIEKQVKKPMGKVRAAVHYGCHLLRPGELGRPVDSENPIKMEKILVALGAEPDGYPEKLDCCGAPILVNLPESAFTKTGQKLQAVQEQGFDVFVDVCPWCHKMFDGGQRKAGETVAAKLEVPVMYLSQFVGLALGINKDKLGLGLNKSPVDRLGGV
jgi:heterodisulfide reductase subunit B